MTPLAKIENVSALSKPSATAPPAIPTSTLAATNLAATVAATTLTATQPTTTLAATFSSATLAPLPRTCPCVRVRACASTRTLGADGRVTLPRPCQVRPLCMDFFKNGFCNRRGPHNQACSSR